MARFRSGFLALVAAAGVSTGVYAIVLDPTFGYGTGVVTGPVNIGVTGLALEPDGSIIAVGGFDGGEGIALLKYTHAGVLDPTFGSAGVATNFTSLNLHASTVAIQADGRIVVVGTLYSGLTASIFVARSMPDGSIDGSFGSGGSVTTSLNPGGDNAVSVVL